MDWILLQGLWYLRTLVFPKRLWPFFRQVTTWTRTPFPHRGPCIIVSYHCRCGGNPRNVLRSVDRRPGKLTSGQSETGNIPGILVMPMATIFSAWGCTHLGYGFWWETKTGIQHASHTHTHSGLCHEHVAVVFIHLASIQLPIGYVLWNDLWEVRLGIPVPLLTKRYFNKFLKESNLIPSPYYIFVHPWTTSLLIIVDVWLDPL